MSLFFLRGWFVIWYYLSPSRPDPCMNVVGVLFFFLCLVCSRRRFPLLLLSPRRWGNPNPSWGFGVPLVFSSSRPHSRTSTRSPRSTSTPRSLPRPVFFFRSSFALGCGRFVSWCLVLGGQVLGRSVFRLGVLVGFGPAFAALLQTGRNGAQPSSAVDYAVPGYPSPGSRP